MASETKNEVEFCYAWPLGECKWGSECSRVETHHPKLDPALEGSKGDMLPNGQYVACQRCVQNLLPCDKSGRGFAADDPCSECRHFGGENARCLDVEPTSYNDAAWKLMMTRRNLKDPNDNFTLPAYDTDKLRGELRKPMKQADLKHDWRGKTKEELRALPDMFSSEVRALPRAYVVPPRPNHKQQRSRPDLKRPASLGSFADTTTTPARTTTSIWPFVFPPAPELPPRDAIHGECIYVTYTRLDNRWTYEYEDGLKVSGYASGPPLPSKDNKHAMQSRPTISAEHPQKKQRHQ